MGEPKRCIKRGCEAIAVAGLYCELHRAAVRKTFAKKAKKAAKKKK